MTLSRFAVGCLAIAIALASRSAAADGHLQAGPTLLELGPGGAATRLVLSNTGDAPVAAQVRVYAWSQPDGEDRLAPSDDLAVSPPIVEIPAGGEQIVRIVRTGNVPLQQDGTYRVVVDELPRANAAAGTTVALRMRYVLPAFVRAAGASPPQVSCAVDSGRTRLVCENGGGRAAQLGGTRLVDEGGQAVSLSAGLFGYVLPASRRVWLLPAAHSTLAGPTLRLETRLNGQPTTLTVDGTP